MNEEILKRLQKGELKLEDLFNNKSYFFESFYDEYEVLTNPYYNGENLKLTIINDNGNFKINDNYIIFLKCKNLINKRNIMFMTKKNPSFYKKMIENNFHYLDFFRVKNFYQNFLKNKRLLSIKKDANNLLNLIEKEQDIAVLKDNIKEFFKENNILDTDIFVDIDENEINEKNRGLLISSIKELENKYNPLNFLDLPIEKIEDVINKKEIKHNYESIISKRISGNYGKMLTKRSYEIIHQLAKIGVDQREFHKNFSKKISVYKNEKDLEDGLEKYFKTKVGWTKEAYLEKIREYENNNNNNNNKVNYFLKNEKMVIRIKDYNESAFFGSNNWCISYNKYDFENYVENKDAMQIFVFDFKLKPENSLSMIGFTIEKKGNITYAHDKLDECCLKTVKENKLFDEIKENKEKLIVKSNDLINLASFDKENMFFNLLKNETIKNLESIEYKIRSLPDEFHLNIIKRILNDKEMDLEQNLHYIPELFRKDSKGNDLVLSFIKNKIKKMEADDKIFLFRSVLTNMANLNDKEVENLFLIMSKSKEEFKESLSINSDSRMVKKAVYSGEYESVKLFFGYFNQNRDSKENNTVFKSIKNKEIKEKLFNIIIEKEIKYYPEIVLLFQDDDLKKYGNGKEIDHLNKIIRTADDVEKILNKIDLRKNKIVFDVVKNKIKEKDVLIDFSKINSNEIFLELKEKGIFSKKDYDEFIFYKLEEFDYELKVDKKFIKSAEDFLERIDKKEYNEHIEQRKSVIRTYKRKWKVTETKKRISP